MALLDDAGTRMGAGLTVIGGRVTGWPGKGVDATARVFRWVGLGIAGWLLWLTVSAGVTGLVLVLVSLLAACWRAGKPDAAQPAEGPSVPGARRSSSAEVRAWLAPRIRRLIGDSNAVFVETLLNDLVADGLMPAETRVTDFRAELTRHSIPTRDQVHIGKASRIGIHRDDLAALEQLIAATTPPPVEVSE